MKNMLSAKTSGSSANIFLRMSSFYRMEELMLLETWKDDMLHLIVVH